MYLEVTMSNNSTPQWMKDMLYHSTDQLADHFRSMGNHAKDEAWFQLYHDLVWAISNPNRRSLAIWLKKADAVMLQLGFALSVDNRKTLMLSACVDWDPQLALWFGSRLGMAPEEWTPLIQDELIENACIDDQRQLRRVRRLAQLVGVTLDKDWESDAAEGIQQYQRTRNLFKSTT